MEGGGRDLLLTMVSDTPDSDPISSIRGEGGGGLMATLSNQIVYKVCDPSQEKEKGWGVGEGGWIT